MAAKLWIALALAATGLAATGVAGSPASGDVHAQALEMQVEEPAPASPPINPNQEAGQWKGKASNPTLNKAQRTAYEERRKQVEAMTSEVREKREALQNSTAGDRAARVKDLEQLILDPPLDAGKLEKLEKRLEKQAEVKAKSLEKKLEKQEGKREKSIEKKLEKLDRELDALDKQRKQDKGKPGK